MQALTLAQQTKGKTMMTKHETKTALEAAAFRFGLTVEMGRKARGGYRVTFRSWDSNPELLELLRTGGLGTLVTALRREFNTVRPIRGGLHYAVVVVGR